MNMDGYTRAVSRTHDAPWTGSKVTEPHASRKQGWRPWTLSPLTHVIVGLASLALIAAWQVLASIGASQGGLAFAPIDADFPIGVIFAYRYLPIILGVIINIIWGCVDLDSKRLEPFFQMSHGEPVSPENSVLLQYTEDFVVTVPFKATKRRHWVVAITSLTSILISWLIVPLEAAVLSTASLQRNINTGAVQGVSLATLTKAASTLDMRFLQDTWTVLWYNQSFPAFTTANGTLLPFRLDQNEQQRSLSNGVVRLNSTLFFATLECRDAVINQSNVSSLYLNPWGSECNITRSFLPAEQDRYNLLYFGQNDNARVSWNLPAISNGCRRSKFPHDFVGYWNNTHDKPPTATGAGVIFCRPSYWAQESLATLHQSNMSVINVTGVGAPRLLTTDVFNSTQYELLLDAGSFPDNDGDLDAPNVMPLGILKRLSLLDVPLRLDMPTMSGIAIGAAGGNVTGLMNRNSFVEAVTKSHALTFSLAASQMLSGNGGEVSRTSPTVTGDSQAIVVNGTAKILLQVLLAVVAALTFTSALLLYKRPSRMACDPASLAVTADMTRHTLFPAPGQGPIAETYAYRLERSEHGSFITSTYTGSRPHPDGDVINDQMHSPSHPQSIYFFGRLSGAVFMVFLVAVIAVLLGLQAKSVRENGLPVVDASRFAQNILLNYLPVVLAILVLEPLWMFLAITFGILQPFEELRRGNALPSRSIHVRYSSVVPLLSSVLALRRFHVLLALVCLAGFSMNILSVGLGALFVQKVVPSLEPFPALSTLGRSLSSNSSFYSRISGIQSYASYKVPDHFYVADINLTRGAQLPLWTTHDTVLTPFGCDNRTSLCNDYNVTSMSAPTQGINLASKCYALPMPTKNGTFQLISQTKSQSGSLLATIDPVSFPGLPSCPGMKWDNGQSSWRYNLSDASASSWEAFTLVSPSNTTSKCPPLLLGMFIRDWQTRKPWPPKGGWTDKNNETFYHFGDAHTYSSASFLVCDMALSVAQYQVTADTLGRVLSSERVSEPITRSETIDTVFHGNESAAVELVTTMKKLIGISIGSGYSDTIRAHTSARSSQWIPYLMSNLDKEHALVDPTKPLPDTSTVVRLAEDVISLLGAVILSLDRWHIFDKPPRDAEPRATSPSGSVPQSSRDTSAMQGFYTARRARIFLDSRMLPLVVAILGFQLVTVLLFYARRPRPLLAEMPTNIAARARLFRGSSLLREHPVAWRDGQMRLAYGTFEGTDERMHTGIDIAGRVVGQGTGDVGIRKRRNVTTDAKEKMRVEVIQRW